MESTTAVDTASLRINPSATATVDLDVVIPVYNEERGLRSAVEHLVAYLRRLPLTAIVTIADNASTDGTWPEACLLSERFAEVRAIHLADKGRCGPPGSNPRPRSWRTWTWTCPLISTPCCPLWLPC